MHDLSCLDRERYTIGLRLGTAGWGIPRDQATRFPGSGTHLARYGAAMSCAEINSSFYRPHRASTYERWAASTPAEFRFSVKVPKAITHECGLAPGPGEVGSFLQDLEPLGSKLGPLLLQLPPKQAFAAWQARKFLAAIRDAAPGAQVVIEPRHPEWFTPAASELLRDFRVARVIADPPPKGAVTVEEGLEGLAYYRLHGSPRMYYSSYGAESLRELGEGIRRRLESAQEVWCIFDNTASGAALGDAVRLRELLGG